MRDEERQEGVCSDGPILKNLGVGDPVPLPRACLSGACLPQHRDVCPQVTRDKVLGLGG